MTALLLWVIILALGNAYIASTSSTLQINIIVILLGLLTIIAPFVYFILLAHALYKLRGFKDHFQLSRKQVMIQLISNGAYAIGDCLPLFSYPFTPSFYALFTVTMVTNWFGFFVLI